MEPNRQLDIIQRLKDMLEYARDHWFDLPPSPVYVLPLRAWEWFEEHGIAWYRLNDEI